MKKMLFLICFLANITYGLYKEPKGFLWYNEDEDIQKKEEKKQEQKQEEIAKQAEQNIEKDKKDFQDKLNIALDNPTIENLIEFRKIQEKIAGKTSKFADLFALAALLDPKAAQSEMQNPLLMDINQKLQNEEIKYLLSKIPEQWGLVLQVSKDCPFSIGFSGIVKEFAEKFHFQLYALSDVDEEFWGINTILDNGIVRNENPERKVPALFLIKKDASKSFPIARTLITEDQIVNNIFIIQKNIGGFV